MRKILCICNTYYQLIFSMQLRKTLFSNDYVALLLSDHSKNALAISQRLKQSNYFNETHYVQTKNIDYVTAINPFHGVKDVKKIMSELDEKCFDEMLFFNFSKSTYLFFSLLYKQNNQIKTYRYEEGILSYNTPLYKEIPITIFSHINQMMYHLRGLFNIFNLTATVSGFYCFYPEVYKNIFPALKVPLIAQNSGIGETIVKIFAADICDHSYEEKYIFFTSVYDFEGGEAIREFDLVKKIAAVVGKDNILIKMHPRDTRTVYADEGFHIDTNSSIPFEALLFAYDFSDKILLSATSGAVLSASLMLENSPQTYYLYPLCKLDGNQTAKGTISQIDQLLGNKSLRKQLNRIHVCDCIDEVFP